MIDHPPCGLNGHTAIDTQAWVAGIIGRSVLMVNRVPGSELIAPGSGTPACPADSFYCFTQLN